MKAAGREQLEQWLRRYEPSEATEERHVQRMRRLLGGTAAPFSRHQFEPGHFTASAFVLHPERDAILLIRHAKLGRWLQPGGHVEVDDPDIEGAARREVCEETGLSELLPLGSGPEGLLLDLDVHAIPALGASPAHEHYDVRCVFRAKGSALTAGSDAAGARWVPLDEVNTIESDDSVMRAVAKLQMLLGR